MSAIARLLIFENKVTGSDITNSDITKKLENYGVKITYAHKKENVIGADIIIRSASIHDDNIEIIEAKKRGIKILSRAFVLGEISKEYKNVITISGSHGKTTTTGMIGSCFLNAGLDPTIHIGGELKEIDGNIFIGKKDYFITEACEYVDSFLCFKGNSTVALNIEADHMDYFKTFDNLKNSFYKYLNNTKINGYNVINIDDENLENLKINKKSITYAIKNKTAKVRASNIRICKFSKYSFDVLYENKKIFRVKLTLPGYHEIYNALACICVCLQYGINDSIIKYSLENFKGIKRRFEYVGKFNRCTVIHDYAHHPTEIEANIKAVKNQLKGRVIVVFQPHTYSRTKTFFDEFVKSLALADIVYLYKIYAAREEQIQGVTSDIVSDKIRDLGTFSKSFDDYQYLKKELTLVANNNDIILILGAGDIESFGNFLCE